MKVTTSSLICSLLLICSFPVLANDRFPDAWGWLAKEQKAKADLSPERSSQNRAALYQGSVVDGSGDTFGGVTPALDILSVSSSYTSSTLLINVLFNLTVLPCENGIGVIRPTEVSVNGFIDLDTDQNISTGGTPFTSTSGIGQDYYLDLCSYASADGAVDIVNGVSLSISGRAPVTFSGTGMSIAVPLSLIGNDDGQVNLAMVVGTMAALSDTAPNAGFLASVPSAAVATGAVSVPTLSGLALFSLALFALLAGLLGLQRRAREE